MEEREDGKEENIEKCGRDCLKLMQELEINLLSSLPMTNLLELVQERTV